MKKFRNWFPQAQAEFKAQTAELEAQVSQKNLAPLPSAKLFALSEKIDSLPIPPAYLEAVKSKLSEAITLWQEEENAPNSLIVLGSPMEPFAQLFEEILADGEKKDCLQFKSLSWSSRPGDCTVIKPQLAEELDPLRDINSDHPRQIVVIIPDLSWCFLRCVHGLDGIEYLQDLFFKNPTVFWLIGCNTWTWEYLDVIFRFRNYFPQTLYLPELEDIELKEWLTPVSETIDFEFSHQQEKKDEAQELDEEKEDQWESKSQQSYFEYLAKISLGMSHVASRLWLLSLGVDQEEDKSAEDGDSEENESEEKIILQKIVLPDLPSLTKDDRYLLFSLCLHGQMTLFELAMSLGDEQIRVQRQVQILCHAGVIEQRGSLLKINPAYYPQLKRDLTNNNFLIKGDR